MTLLKMLSLLQELKHTLGLDIMTLLLKVTLFGVQDQIVLIQIGEMANLIIQIITKIMH